MSEQNSFTEKLISGLRKAATELEELRLQAALGKAEASDALDTVRHKFNHYMHEAGVEFNELKSAASVKAEHWKSDLEELQVQFALGKAEAKDAIDQRMKKIRTALHDIKSRIRAGAIKQAE